ncbi:dentin sialophosphoprotein-like [Physella acuta]|uniref:dentin sialophosphoprotein-like n=1 Tax=Physella acuta TaxID=109671 RepID=UPI0027DB3D60|nr:dentin sialophosphoprotein-like [Physella acuta]
MTQKITEAGTLYKTRTQKPGLVKNNETIIYSSAQYICEKPYTQSGEITLHCQPDYKAQPTWSSTNHTCTIPDCSRKYILTQQSGALVHPSHQHQTATSGHVTCAWEIQARGDSRITLHIRYLDLPDYSNTNLAVFDTGRPRPSRLFAARGGVEQVTVTSDTRRVSVVYRGGRDLEGHRGFYIEYTTSHGRRARDVNDVDTDDDVVSAETPIDTTIELQDQQTTLQEDTVTSPTDGDRSTDQGSSVGDGTDVSGPAVGETLPDVVTDNFPSDVTDGTLYSDVTDSPVQSTALTQSSDVTTSPSPALFVSSGSNGGADDSNDGWKIAVGVVIPLLVLLIGGVGGYILYRRKYPVRMIIGRDFAKFSNPEYQTQKRPISLVRDDADDYFATRSLGPDELNPVNRHIDYDNPAFVRDENDAVNEEEEEERKFRKEKPWLFKNSTEDVGRNDSRGFDSTDQSTDSVNSTDQSDKVSKSGSNASLDEEIDKLLSQQQPTPIPRTRRKLQRENATVTISDSSDEDKAEDEESKSNISTNDNDGKSTPDESENKDESGGESEYVKIAKTIFEQPTYEEVSEIVRSRARSMSLERAPVESRARSFSFDPWKSARKTSLRDGTVWVEHLKAVANRAVIVEGTGSGEFLVDESLLDGLPLEERDRCLSMSSVNSNPHLVTDLDESLGSSEEPQNLEVVESLVKQEEPHNSGEPHNSVISESKDDKEEASEIVDDKELDTSSEDENQPVSRSSSLSSAESKSSIDTVVHAVDSKPDNAGDQLPQDNVNTESVIEADSYPTENMDNLTLSTSNEITPENSDNQRSELSDVVQIDIQKHGADVVESVTSIHDKTYDAINVEELEPSTLKINTVEKEPDKNVEIKTTSIDEEFEELGDQQSSDTDSTSSHSSTKSANDRPNLLNLHQFSSKESDNVFMSPPPETPTAEFWNLPSLPETPAAEQITSGQFSEADVEHSDDSDTSEEDVSVGADGVQAPKLIKKISYSDSSSDTSDVSSQEPRDLSKVTRKILLPSASSASGGDETVEYSVDDISMYLDLGSDNVHDNITGAHLSLETETQHNVILKADLGEQDEIDV